LVMFVYLLEPTIETNAGFRHVSTLSVASCSNQIGAKGHHFVL
jgi:hypothetical protein